MRYFLIGLGILLFMISCSDLNNLQDLEALERDAVFAFPLVNSEVSMKDALNDLDNNQSLLIEADGLLRFFYRGDTTYRTSDEIFAIINKFLPPLIPIGDTLSGFSVASVEFDVEKVIFKKGVLEYSFFNANSNTVEVTVTIPQITKNGISISKKHTISAFSTLPINSFDLTEAVFTPQNDSLYIQYQAKQTTGELVKLNNFFMVPKNIDYKYADGLLGTQIFESDEDTLDIDYYNSWTKGIVNFEEPRVIINILNSYGFPALATVEKFDVITLDKSILAIESPLVKNGFTFNYPTFEEIGEIKTSTFIFDKTNSNMANIINAGPTALIYDLDAISDPNLNAKGFITDSSYFAYSVDASFPLYGSLADFTLYDTLNIDFSDLGNVKAVELKAIIENGIPLGATFQGYFLDKNAQVLDSLFSEAEQVIAPAQVNSQGLVTKVETQTTLIPLDIAKWNRVKTAQQLVLQTILNTTNGGRTSVKIFSEQKFKVRIGAKVGI